MINYIFDYYQKIKTGEEVVGRWVRLQYEIIIKGLEEKRFYYAPKKAMAAIKFIENFVHHHEGALAPQLIKLELWELAMISVVFGIVDEEGLRQFREILTVVGRKNGKTLMMSGVAEYETFLGDYGARVYFTAPKLEQANLCFEAMLQSIGKEPELMALTKKRRTDIYVEAKNATAKPLAYSAGKSDGLNISCAICDEISSWKGAQGLKFYEVLKSSQGARKEPLIWSITTAGYQNEGIYDELIKRATRVLLGDSKETRLAAFIYMIDDAEKWNDINELRKSNPNLNVSISVDYLLEEIAIAEGSLSKKAEFLTKHANIKQNSSQAWLPTSAIARCSGEELTLEQFRNSYCVAGLDLSRTTDLTSAALIIEKDGRLNVISHFWLPEEKLDEAIARDGVPYREYIAKGWLTLSGQNFVDYEDVFNWFRALIEIYEIYPLKVGYDRYSSQYLIKSMEAYGFQCDDVFQGYNLTGPILELEGLLKDGAVNLGNNDLLKMHLLDTALYTDTESRRVKIIKLSSHAHIDGAAALLDAVCVRQKWFADIGDQLRNGG